MAFLAVSVLNPHHFKKNHCQTSRATVIWNLTIVVDEPDATNLLTSRTADSPNSVPCPCLIPSPDANEKTNLCRQKHCCRLYQRKGLSGRGGQPLYN